MGAKITSPSLNDQSLSILNSTASALVALLIVPFDSVQNFSVVMAVAFLARDQQFIAVGQRVGAWVSRSLSQSALMQINGLLEFIITAQTKKALRIELNFPLEIGGSHIRYLMVPLEAKLPLSFEKVRFDPTSHGSTHSHLREFLTVNETHLWRKDYGDGYSVSG